MSSGMSAGLAMQIAPRLEMALTPQMIQSMEFLQMPLMQLEQRLRQEQLENPVFELADLETDDGFGADADAVDEADDAAAADADDASGLERVDELDIDWDDVYDDDRPLRLSRNDDDDEQYNPVTNAEARPPSLVDHLLTQLSETPMADRLRRLAGGMVEKLDANGWLTVPLAETVPEGEESPDEQELGQALAEVQKLDPDGVGARNLAECLLLQLKNRPGSGEIAEGVVKSHLEDLAANRLPKIAKALACEIDDVKRAADLIRTLNPRPGADYSAAPALAVKPELIVDEGGDGFTVRLASGANPQVSDFFVAVFDNSRRGKMLRERMERDPARAEAFQQFREQMRRSGLTRKFREKYNNAQWLVKAVAQREKTLLSVTEEIVNAQRDYLSRKTPAPAPLFMQEIADRVGYDISTVSRAVKEKYIDTPLGIKPLKDFFSRASGGAAPGSEAASNASVLVKIREMIESEDKRRPLRDNEIMERLARDGIELKRRSIVNYREKLGYPSHSHRKEH